MDKKAKQLTEAELAEKIDRLVLLRPQANEYRQLCGQVKAALQARGLQQFMAPSGCRARLDQGVACRWIVAMLQTVLPRGVFYALCPRKAETKKLNQRLAAVPEDKELAKCRVVVPGKIELSVLARGETETAVVKLHDDEAAEEVA